VFNFLGNSDESDSGGEVLEPAASDYDADLSYVHKGCIRGVIGGEVIFGAL
jgi:hypothetical protein